MLTWMDSTWSAVAAYLLASVLAVCLWRIECVQNRTRPGIELWPRFWLATAALLATMAVGRAGEAGELLVDLGRRQSRSDGWYDTRRSIQLWVIGSVLVLWALVVIAAIWQVPERRRRSLPTTLMVFTLACFAGVRIISLHQVDAVLHNREVQGATIGAIVEWVLLAGTFLVVSLELARPTTRRARPDASRVPPASSERMSGHRTSSGRRVYHCRHAG